MNSDPRNPSIKRPPGLSGPEVSSVGTRSAAKKLTNGKTGFLVSLGIHGCLLATASITFMHSTDEGSAGDEASGDPVGFEMTSAALHPEAEESVSKTSPLPQRPVPVMVVKSSAAVELPPVEPMALVSANNKPAAPATPPAATGKSSAAGDHAAAKSTGRKGTGGKGAGRGEVTKRSSPVPPPSLLSAPPPSYPAAAKAARKSGKVAVLIEVRADGSAASTRVYQSSGHPQLDQAAVEGARRWTFSRTPSLGSGATIEVVVTVTFAR